MRPLIPNDVQLAHEAEAINHQYKFNGLKHSLEWMLNDTYDALQRRIYITPLAKPPVYFWLDEAEQPVVFWGDEADTPVGNWLDEENFNAVAQTTYEFTIYIPFDVVFIPAEVFEKVSVYRFAGLRPRIMVLDEFQFPVETHPDNYTI
jgi:hypothetical protein